MYKQTSVAGNFASLFDVNAHHHLEATCFLSLLVQLRGCKSGLPFSEAGVTSGPVGSLDVTHCFLLASVARRHEP